MKAQDDPACLTQVGFFILLKRCLSSVRTMLRFFNMMVFDGHLHLGDVKVCRRGWSNYQSRKHLRVNILHQLEVHILSRINIEDSLFKDKRFYDLGFKLGSLHAALGAITHAFILAQKHYLNEDNERLIPELEWKEQGGQEVLIEVGLAERRALGIYVKGSNEQFKWLLQKQEAGRKSSERKRTSVERTYNGSQPLTLTLPLKESTAGENTQQLLDQLNQAINKLKPLWIKTYKDEIWIDFELNKAGSYLASGKPKNSNQLDVWINQWLAKGWNHERKVRKGLEPKASAIEPMTIEEWEVKNGTG